MVQDDVFFLHEYEVIDSLSFSAKMGLLQNAVFRPERKICALKKLLRTAFLAVLNNFFSGLIFQNSILQQAHLNYRRLLEPRKRRRYKNRLMKSKYSWRAE